MYWPRQTRRTTASQLPDELLKLSSSKWWGTVSQKYMYNATFSANPLLVIYQRINKRRLYVKLSTTGFTVDKNEYNWRVEKLGIHISWAALTTKLLFDSWGVCSAAHLYPWRTDLVKGTEASFYIFFTQKIFRVFMHF